MPELNLKFKNRAAPNKRYPDRPSLNTLTVHHPQKGPVGSLEYYPHEDHLAIQHLSVPREHRGNGYASHLMDELQRRHPGVAIDHGERTEDGHDWWDSYSAGKDVTNGRTMAALKNGSGYLEPLDEAQRGMYLHHPVWHQDLGSEEDATRSFQHLLRRGGHPEADDAEAFKHPTPGWHQSQLGRGDVGQLTAAIHPDRWDYGTLAHETAHALHALHTGQKPTSLEHAHDDGFMEHYRTVGNMIAPGAGDTLHAAYRRARYGEEPDHGRTAGKGKPRHDAPELARRTAPAAAERPEDLAPDPGGDADRAGTSGTLRALSEHPKIDSDLAKLAPKLREVYQSRVDDLRRGVAHSSTHALNGPLKGWQATSLNHSTRLVHRTAGRDLHVLSVGNHDETYDIGKRRARYNGPSPDEEMSPAQRGRETFARPAEEGTPQRPAGFRYHDPSTWGPDYTRHAQDHPNKIAVAHAHQSVRQLHPGITESIGVDRRGGSQHVQHVLGELGHPDAEYAFAMKHPKPEHRVSSPVYDGDGIPGVALHPQHWDVEHAAHEIAHIMHNHETGRTPGSDIDDEHNLGPGFVRHFRDALNVTHPGAGDDLGEHYQHWKGQVDRLRRSAKRASQRGLDDIPGVDDVTETPWHRPGSNPRFGDLPVQRVPVSTLHRTQSAANTLPSEAGEGAPEPVRVVRHQGTNWLYDGHHRLLHALDTGRTHLDAHVLDLDQRRQGRYTAPTKRLFGPTYGLDSRLFEGDQLKPSLRAHIARQFLAFCSVHGYRDWPSWAKIVFFGSEASEWTDPDRHGNNDFDLSIGIHYPRFRLENASYAALSDEEIAAMFTEQMHARLNDPQKTFPGVEGTYDQTWFANLRGWDITAIRPYSAYDVVAGEWIVRPPHLPSWSLKDFPEGPGLAKEIRGIVDMAEGILAMPEPYRTQNGSALWEYVHENRSNAFGPQGEGWWDSRNVVEKALDQKGLMQGLFDCHKRAVEDPSSLDSPSGWSNDPSTYPVIITKGSDGRAV